MCFFMAPAYQFTIVKLLSLRQLVGGVYVASKWKLNLMSASIAKSLRITIPLSTMSSHPDQEYPVPGVCLQELWMKPGSKATASREPIQGVDKALLKDEKSNIVWD